jgi:signal transduction histidine kinase
VLLNARLDETHAVLTVAAGMPAVLGQSSLVELLFQNLLTNAMRYTSEGIEPRIDVAAERMADLVIVTVSDNGIGIPTRELERVFAPFHKVQAYRQAEGSGLGLAICKRIATALGGRIWAESENGRGSRLCVALQAAPATARDAGPERCEIARG